MLGNMLDKTCVIKKLTTTTTSMGGSKKTYTNHRSADFPCSIKAMTLKEIDAYGKLTLFNILRFYLEYSETRGVVGYSDQIIYDGDTYDIKAINDVAGKNRLLQIDALRVE